MRAARPKIVWVVPDLSHYHVPRIEAFARLDAAEVHVIELSDTGGFKAFRASNRQARTFGVETLFHGIFFDNIDIGELRDKLFAALDRLRPDVLLVQGWAEAFALLLMTWAIRQGKPAVVTSESTAGDAPRQWLREKIKACVVRQFDAALVGGQPHAAYLRGLGMPAEKIFSGYDAVDNDHFASGADRARSQADALRAEHWLPPRYFLASARFIAKKNLSRLLQAYAGYRRGPEVHRSGPPRDLVILGDGPLRPEIEKQVGDLQLRESVHLPGFRAYDELPVFYGLADAFIHPSTTEQWGLVVNEAMAAGLPVIVSERCGCTPDLIVHGKNGYQFDPEKALALTNLLVRFDNQSAAVLAKMGEASRNLIARWSPEFFAQGLHAAIGVALASPSRRGRQRASLLLLQALICARSRRVE